MKKEGLLVVVLLLFSVSVFAGTSSDTDTELGIDGCTDYNEDIPLDEQVVNFARVGECIPDANAFCAAQNTPLDSFSVPNACSMGNPYGSGYSGDVCCGGIGGDYGCVVDNRNGADAYYCVAALGNCEDFGTERLCLNDGATFDPNGANVGQCYWDENRRVCIPFSRGCYDYEDSADCDDDVQGVSVEDPNCKYGEFKVGGIPYVVSRDTCKCVWDDPDGILGNGDESCGLRYNITTSYGDGSRYSLCTFIHNIIEGCEEGDIGFEKYIYISDYDESTMPVDGLLSSDVGCADRTGQRRCDVPIVKVPFFSFVNVLLVVLCVFMVYCLRTKFYFWYK